MIVVGANQIIAGALLVFAGFKIMEFAEGLHTLGLLAVGYGAYTLYTSVQHIDPPGVG